MTDPRFHITTPRVYLSYFQPSDPTHCDFLVTLYNTSSFIATSITTCSASEKRLSGRFREEHTRNGYGTYLVRLRPPSTWNEPEDETTPFPERLAACKHVGTVSLIRGESPTVYSAPDLGSALLPEETRKRYARETSGGGMGGLLAWAQKKRGVRVVLGLHDTSN
ncbi:hypothetical protein PMIN06_006453 [Paraphaeosphaeria minitans]